MTGKIHAGEMIYTQQPAAHIQRPEGATHWDAAFAYPFEKHEMMDGVETRFIFMAHDIHGDVPKIESGAEDDGWKKVFPHSRLGWRGNPIPLVPTYTPSPDMRKVNTTYGTGWVCGNDGVRLLVVFGEEVTQFTISPVALMPNEVFTIRGRK